MSCSPSDDWTASKCPYPPTLNRPAGSSGALLCSPGPSTFQRIKVSGESVGRASNTSGAGADRSITIPGDSQADAERSSDKIAVLALSQRCEAADGDIGGGRATEVGAVHVPVSGADEAVGVARLVRPPDAR